MNRLYFNNPLNLSATKAVMAPPSCTDSILLDCVDDLEVKHLGFALLFPFCFALLARRVEGL